MDFVNADELPAAKEAVAERIHDQGVHYRILLIGRPKKAVRGFAASVGRALRNLGHHLFELDLDAHGTLLGKHEQAVGDPSPMLLDPIALDRFCGMFLPQIIVVCVDDALLAVEHAQKLRENGVVLVGISSRPPEATRSHPSRPGSFDFHTAVSRSVFGILATDLVHGTHCFSPAFDRGAMTGAHAPERCRRVSPKTFQRIFGRHLFEHRCMALLEIMFNCSPDTTPWLEESRIRSIRKTLAQSQDRCKQVIVSGFYGAGNLGDELILRAISSAVRARDAAVQVCVAAENAAAVERDHGLQAFDRKSLSDAEHHARTACAILVGGGGLWHDYTFERGGGLIGIFQEPQVSMASYATLPVLGRFFDVPCHVVGMGVGPVRDPDAFRMLRFVAELAETIQVRDEPSSALLSKAGVRMDKVSVAPDLAFALTLPRVEPSSAFANLKAEGYTILGINLRPWKYQRDATHVAHLAQALDRVAASCKLAIVTIPMQECDNVVLADLLSRCGGAIKTVTLKGPLSLEELLGVLGSCDAVLSMRLHPCLVAHRLRKPVVNFVYDPKVGNHFEQLGRSAFAAPLEALPSDLIEKISVALGERGRLPTDACDRLHRLESEARVALDCLAERVAALPCVNRVFQAPKETVSIRGELKELRAAGPAQKVQKWLSVFRGAVARSLRSGS